MLRELTTNEKLDAVLKFLNDDYTASFPKGNTFAVGLYPEYQRSKHEISIGVSFGERAEHINELALILEYLKDVEKYITSHQYQDINGPYLRYSILYEGKVFIESGGYVGRARVANWKSCTDYIQTLALTIGTVLAGIGGIGLLVIEIYRVLHAK